MNICQELVELYGSGKIARVEKSEAFTQLCKKYRNTEGYEPERLRIRSFRKSLEGLCIGLTNDDQVKICLKLLSGEKDKKNRTDYHQLIRKAYMDFWSVPQKEHYDYAYNIIEGDIFFFLSFTSRSNTPGQVNKVNQENRYFLEDVFWSTNLSEVGNLSDENLLAIAICRYLKQQGISGFYYPQHEGMSNNILQKLRNKCHESLTFIQLIQGVMFDPKRPNYCHFEYEETLKSPASRKRIYILGEARRDIKARNYLVPNDLQPWFNEVVNDVDALELAPTRYRDDTAVQANHKALVDKIVKKIERIRDNLFENVPA